MTNEAKSAAPVVILVMGVAGSGKTTVARLLAERLGAVYEEGDAYHSPQNVERMRSGTPLTDADRGPWLERLAARIDDWLRNGRRTVLACSALKQSYRDRLIGGRCGVSLIYLKGTRDLISGRLAARTNHYMPAALLDSQFAALEEPTDAITVDIRCEPQEIAASIATNLAPRQPE